MSNDLLDIASHRQLFIDDHLTAEKSGLDFNVHCPTKTDERLVVADRPWEDVMIGPYCTVIDDAGRYRMWYESYSKIDAPKPLGVLCYAESDDGRIWHKPELGILPFKGSTANNIVFPPPGKKYHGGTVFRDPTARPEERYKMVYAIESEGLFGACSPDGLHWSVCDVPPLLRNQCDTQNVCFWDDRIEKYVAYVRANVPYRYPNCTRTVGRSETSDFLRWPVLDVVLTHDEQDPADVDLYNSATVKYARARDVYLIVTSLFHHERDMLEPQLAVSRDGIHWTRPERKPFIPLGDQGAFDCAMIHTCVGQIIQNNSVSIFYRGIDRKHSQPYGQTRYGGVISRAVLRADGFVSLHAGSQEGWILTRPVIFDGSRLELNYRAGQDGGVSVELCDRAGNPLDGFRQDECETLSGDCVAARVSWQGRTDVTQLTGSPVRLRFRLKNADLYAFKFSANDRQGGRV